MKLGIVLEGGASRAYFTAGALDAFDELSIKADYVIGSSAGIANGISYVSGQKGRNFIIGTKYLPDRRYMGFWHLLNPFNKSLYNIKFVFEEIPNKHLPFDYDAFNKSGCEVYATLTDINTGECKYKKVDGSDKRWRSLVATCALPLLFQPIKVDGSYYMDGGITDPIPFVKALSDGCDKVIVILTRPRDYVKEEESALEFCRKIYRKYPDFADTLHRRTEVYNDNHAYALELEKEGKIFILAPEDTDGWKRTERRPEMIEKIYQAGYDCAMQNIDKLKDYLKK